MNHAAYALAVALVLFGASVAVVRAQSHGAGSSTNNLLQIGQAVLMYANENKGHVPPDLGKLGKYVRGNLDVFVSPRRATPIPPEVREKPEGDASALWFNTRCDYVLTVPPGTRLSRLRDPARFPLVVEKPAENDGPVGILYADGHVVEYAPNAVPDRGRGSNAEGPAASRPAHLVPTSTSPAAAATRPADFPVGKLPEDLPAALVGAWRIRFEPFIEATYQFDADRTFTLSFPAIPGISPRGKASGTWKLDGAKLTLSNVESSTPLTVAGELEECEVVGVSGDALAVRTTNRKGAEEVLIFRKVIPFAKGKHDNPKIIGTWQGERALLVLAPSGLMVLNVEGRTVKGEWSQAGSQLLVLTEPAPVARGTRRIEPEPPPRERPLTIEHVDDTTLVLAGVPLSRDKDEPVTLLRVK